MTTTDTTQDAAAATASGAEPNIAGTGGSAGTGQPDTRHEDEHHTGNDGAATGQNADRARRLLWLDPRTLAVHPRNVRDDLGDLTGLAASIAAQGVLEALTVIPHTPADTGGGGESGFLLVAGHRRAAAAVLAGLDVVPCVVSPDLAADPAVAGDGRGERAAQAGQVAAMLAENLHRRGLSAVEEARGVQTMLDLGATLTAVAKTTGLGRKRVAKAAGVARLDRETAAAVSAAGLTLDQAAAVAVFADDPATAATLIQAAEEGPGRFAHALTRARQEREDAERTARLAAELAAAGRTVLDETEGERATPISRLVHDGQPLTAEAHAGCPGAAVYLAAGWDGPRPVEVCTDPAAHGHTSRWPSTPRPNDDSGGEPREEQREAVAAARREVIENNKAMAAANATRREWVKALLQRRTAPKAALRFAVDTLATDPRSVARWLSGQPNTAAEQAAADLGLAAPGQWRPDGTEPPVTLTSGEPLPDTRLPVALLAHVAAAIESGIDRQSWRTPSAGDARWLCFLADAGYTLADIEQQIINTIGPAGDATVSRLTAAQDEPGANA